MRTLFKECFEYDWMTTTHIISDGETAEPTSNETTTANNTDVTTGEPTKTRVWLIVVIVIVVVVIVIIVVIIGCLCYRKNGSDWSKEKILIPSDYSTTRPSSMKSNDKHFLTVNNM